MRPTRLNELRAPKPFPEAKGKNPSGRLYYAESGIEIYDVANHRYIKALIYRTDTTHCIATKRFEYRDCGLPAAFRQAKAWARGQQAAA